MRHARGPERALQFIAQSLKLEHIRGAWFAGKGQRHEGAPFAHQKRRCIGEARPGGFFK